jgi:hypothetical protein
VRDDEPVSDREGSFDWLRTRRFVALLAALVVVIGVARCGGSSRSSSSTTTKRSVPATKAAKGGLHIATTSLPNAVQGTRYSVQLTAAGGRPPYHWKKLSVIPRGLHLLVSRKGLLHATPTKETRPGVYTVKVFVQDHTRKTATATLTLQLHAP